MSENQNNRDDVGRVPPRGVPEEPPPRRLRRLHRVWPDRDGNISYLLTMCVEDRGRVLDNETTFERFVAFLLDSPARYHWFGRWFVVMPDQKGERPEEQEIIALDPQPVSKELKKRWSYLSVKSMKQILLPAPSVTGRCGSSVSLTSQR